MGQIKFELVGRNFINDLSTVFSKSLDKATFGVSGAIQKKGLGGGVGLAAGGAIGMIATLLLTQVPEVKMILKLITNLLRIIAEPILKIVRQLLYPLMDMMRKIVDSLETLGVIDVIVGLLKMIAGGILMLFNTATLGQSGMGNMPDDLFWGGWADVQKGWDKAQGNARKGVEVLDASMQTAGTSAAAALSTAGTNVASAIGTAGDSMAGELSRIKRELSGISFSSTGTSGNGNGFYSGNDLSKASSGSVGNYNGGGWQGLIFGPATNALINFADGLGKTFSPNSNATGKFNSGMGGGGGGFRSGGGTSASPPIMSGAGDGSTNGKYVRKWTPPDMNEKYTFVAGNSGGGSGSKEKFSSGSSTYEGKTPGGGYIKRAKK